MRLPFLVTPFLVSLIFFKISSFILNVQINSKKLFTILSIGLLQAVAKSQVLSNVSASEFESLELNGEVLKPRQKLSALKLNDDSTFFLRLKKATPSFNLFGDNDEDAEPKKLDDNASQDGDKEDKEEEKKEEENGEKEQGPKGPDAEEEKDKKKEKKEEFKGFAVTRKDIIDKVIFS